MAKRIEMEVWRGKEGRNGGERRGEERRGERRMGWDYCIKD